MYIIPQKVVARPCEKPLLLRRAMTDALRHLLFSAAMLAVLAATVAAASLK